MSGDYWCRWCGAYFCVGDCLLRVTEEALREAGTKMAEEKPDYGTYQIKTASNWGELKSVLFAYLGDEFFARKFADCIELIRVKNSDYTQGKGSRDRIAHFREAAKDLDLPMMKIWQVFVRKHWATIQKFANGGKLESEPIDGRINDVINYMVLLAAIIEDEKAGDE